MPKENINVREVLTRLAAIHLIRQKVIELVTPAGPNLPPKVLNPPLFVVYFTLCCLFTFVYNDFILDF